MKFLRKSNQWHFGMKAYQRCDARKCALARLDKHRALDRCRKSNVIVDEIQRLKASIGAKVEHPFRVINRQFGFVKVRYWGLAKHAAQLTTPLALSNLWMVRHRWS